MTTITETPKRGAQTRNLPEGWRWVKLGDVCEVNPRRQYTDRNDAEPTSFIPMEAVDSTTGTVNNHRVRPYGEVKKGYTFFAEEDILFAKITPCMQNGKHAVARGLLDGFGFGTTEFHVLRPSQDVLADWVHLYIRQPALLEEATKHFTGAVGQKRLPADFLADISIPLPPLHEQRRLAGELREQMAAVEQARAAAQDRLEAIKAMPAAFLRQVFPQLGQPLPESWKVLPLGEVGVVVSGVTLGRNLSGLHVREVPYLRVANVKDGYLDLTGVATTLATPGEIETLKLQQGDLLLTEGGDPDKLGRGTIWEEQLPDCIHQNHIFRVRLDTKVVMPSFAASLIGSWYGKSYFLKHAKQTTGIATINQRVLKAFPVLVPSIEQQVEIVEMLAQQMASVKEACAAAEAEFKTINALPASLLRRVFNGEM